MDMLNDKTEDKLVRIYPVFCSNKCVFGELYILDAKKCENIIMKYKTTSNMSTNKYTKYMYRNYEFIFNDTMNELSRKTSVDSKVVDIGKRSVLINVCTNESKLDTNLFPILNSYHDETNVDECTIKINEYITLHIVKENGVVFMYLSFLSRLSKNKQIFETIKNILETINLS